MSRVDAAPGSLDRDGLLSWWDGAARDLPWRRTRDPWAVLVSELMLQQTQVARVEARHPRFMARFPTPRRCADAPLGDVLDEWAGLGYNRRARDLHRCARQVTEGHGGRVPDRLDALLDLPGVGPYTARAVLVFAFERHEAVVDTNVGRILARTSGRPLARREAQVAADELVPEGAAWAWNQAMLDLGATVCRARRPGCEGCPVARACRWRAAGHPDPDPATGSAGVGRRQAPFAGSDRQGRGRLVAALREGPVEEERLAEVMGWPGDRERAHRVADRVVADGLARRRGSSVVLP